MANTLLPPPYKGQNDQFPLISIQSPYCERMLNFNNLDGSVKVRQGNDLFAQSTKTNRRLYAIASYGTTALFAIVENLGVNWEIYNITAGTFGALADANNANIGQNPASFYFRNNLIICYGNIGSTTLYDGSTYTTDPYTFSAFSPYGGTEFKARAYFIGYNSTQFAYSGIEAIAGATTQVDLASQLTSKAVLYMIRSVSMTQNLTAESALSFIFSNGEVLVYSGSYPDSPNWSRISRFKVAKPIEHNSYVEAKGDSFIFTESEILSLRNLLVSGYDKERDEGIGAAIAKRWRQCMKAYLADTSFFSYKYVKGVYDEANDRIVISMPFYVNPDTGALVANTLFQLIYDFNLEAWYEYLQTDTEIYFCVGATYFRNSVYLAVESNSGLEMSVVKLEGGSNFVDDQIDGTGTNPIDYNLITAPLPISKFGANAITGVEAIVKSDLYPQTSYKFIADLGRQTTEAQTLPDQGTSIAKPMMNVGIQGAIAAQLQVYGSTVSASIGLEISALNVWYYSGDSGSR